MFDQPGDFWDESAALYEILASIDDADFARKTQFKGWTIDDVIGHLHAWNWAADASLNNVAGFDAMTPQEQPPAPGTRFFGMGLTGSQT